MIPAIKYVDGDIVVAARYTGAPTKWGVVRMVDGIPKHALYPTDEDIDATWTWNGTRFVQGENNE